MAIDSKVWELAKALFMAGKSLSQITEETGISKSQISKRSKKEQWNKETIVTLVSETIDTTIKTNEIKKQKETLNETERDIYEKELLTESTARHLAMNTGQELMKLLLKSAKSGKREHLIKDGLGMGATRHDTMEIELSPTDIKDLTTSFRNLTGGTPQDDGGAPKDTAPIINIILEGDDE